MHFLPHFPLPISPSTLFGLILLLGLIGGEIARRSHFIPSISGYILVGFLVGPAVFNLASPSLLADTRIFIDISLGLILFDLGRQLDFTWLRHDRGILYTALAESSFTFFSTFTLLLAWGVAWLPALLIATIAIASSPAVIMMVAHELSAEGPITRRTLILTSLNNLFAIIIFTLLISFTQPTTLSKLTLILHTIYRLGGSLLLALAMLLITKLISRLTGKNKQAQFVLFVSIVILTIGLTKALNLSTMLALFSLGVLARNIDRKHFLMEIDFGWMAHLFFILLFVVTGANLHVHYFLQLPWLVLIFLFTRIIAKTIAIGLFAKASNLTGKQVMAISLALFPMAGVTIGMSNTVTDYNPQLGHLLTDILSAMVFIPHLLGPITTQFAFLKTGETGVNLTNEEYTP